MKKIMKILPLIFIIFSINYAKESPKSDDEMGIRKVPLNDESKVVLKKYEFSSKAPGESTRYDRSYENAPPQIPHSTEGLMPITKNNNACVSCHAPDVAKDMGATPIPPSHFYSFKDKKHTKELDNARFNCNQCHVPQSTTKEIVKNNFKPEFSNESFKHHSFLMQSLEKKSK